MKKVTTIIAMMGFLAVSTAQAQTQEKYKRAEGDNIQADLTFSPSIKAYDCVLEVDNKMIHIKDIVVAQTTPVEKHDVRGKLQITTSTGQSIQAVNTVNNYNLFKKHFIPRWNFCKNPPANLKQTKTSYD